MALAKAEVLTPMTRAADLVTSTAGPQTPGRTSSIGATEGEIPFTHTKGSATTGIESASERASAEALQQAAESISEAS